MASGSQRAERQQWAALTITARTFQGNHSTFRGTVLHGSVPGDITLSHNRFEDNSSRATAAAISIQGATRFETCVRD